MNEVRVKVSLTKLGSYRESYSKAKKKGIPKMNEVRVKYEIAESRAFFYFGK